MTICISRSLEKRSPKTITDAEKIFEIVRASRLSGVCFTDEELEIGLRAMAVPVKGQNGNIVAAMSVSASAARVSTSDHEAILSFRPAKCVGHPESENGS